MWEVCVGYAYLELKITVENQILWLEIAVNNALNGNNIEFDVIKSNFDVKQANFDQGMNVLQTAKKLKKVVSRARDSATYLW